MPDWINHLLQLFSLSSVGLPAIFVVAFVSATILPMATEPVLFGFVKLNPELFWPAIVVATIGNTLGGMVTYYMGYGAHELLAHDKPSVHLRWLQRLGAPVLLLSWVPLIGDALCAMAGWLRLAWRPVLLWMALGKFIRFVVMTTALLWVPESFWQRFF
jgi:membrane protein YqaA with SNARE-associated domain